MKAIVAVEHNVALTPEFPHENYVDFVCSAVHHLVENKHLLKQRLIPWINTSTQRLPSGGTLTILPIGKLQAWSGRGRIRRDD
jgi:hypothetical protein